MKIGMDIGTSTSSVCVDIDGEKHLIKCGTGSGSTQTFIPSAIYVKEDGTLLVGQAAEQNRSRDPQRFVKSFKRDLGINDPLIVGGKEFLPEQLIEKIILHLKECAEKSEYLNGQAVNEATICHPANFSQKKKDLLIKAGQNAGIETVYLLDEPTAAAQYYHSKQKIAKGEKLLIYDLGGGTFDVSLMENMTEGLKLLTKPLGIDRCGGEDFNYALGEWLDQDEHLNIQSIRAMLPKDQLINFESMLEQQCIMGKELLSSDTSANISLMLASAEVTRETFEQLIKGYVDETINQVEDSIKNAKLGVQQIDKILLVGGSCRIPYIKQRLTELVGDKVVADIDPDLAVVNGSVCNFVEEQKNDDVLGVDYEKADTEESDGISVSERAQRKKEQNTNDILREPIIEEQPILSLDCSMSTFIGKYSVEGESILVSKGLLFIYNDKLVFEKEKSRKSNQIVIFLNDILKCKAVMGTEYSKGEQIALMVPGVNLLAMGKMAFEGKMSLEKKTILITTKQEEQYQFMFNKKCKFNQVYDWVTKNI